MGCNCGAGAAKVEVWIYQSPQGQRTEYASQAEANLQVTKNGGGQVFRKP